MCNFCVDLDFFLIIPSKEQKRKKKKVLTSTAIKTFARKKKCHAKWMGISFFTNDGIVYDLFKLFLLVLRVSINQKKARTEDEDELKIFSFIRKEPVTEKIQFSFPTKRNSFTPLSSFLLSLFIIISLFFCFFSRGLFGWWNV